MYRIFEACCLQYVKSDVFDNNKLLMIIIITACPCTRLRSKQLVCQSGGPTKEKELLLIRL